MRVTESETEREREERGMNAVAVVSAPSAFVQQLESDYIPKHNSQMLSVISFPCHPCFFRKSLALMRCSLSYFCFI